MTFQFLHIDTFDAKYQFLRIFFAHFDFFFFFRVTFRVRAVNSHFKGDFSDPKDLEIGHEILQDAISQLKIVSTADSFVTFQWSKLVPAQAESSPLFG